MGDENYTTIIASLTPGEWHTISCSVVDAFPGGIIILQSNSTFLVRHGSSFGGDFSPLPPIMWRQRHDSCGASWSPPLPELADGPPALLHWCPSEFDSEVEGLVDHVTWYPPHAERLLEEHFMEFYMSNWHRCAGQRLRPLIVEPLLCCFQRWSLLPMPDLLARCMLQGACNLAKRLHYFASMGLHPVR